MAALYRADQELPPEADDLLDDEIPATPENADDSAELDEGDAEDGA